LIIANIYFLIRNKDFIFYYQRKKCKSIFFVRNNSITTNDVTAIVEKIYEISLQGNCIKNKAIKKLSKTDSFFIFIEVTI